MVDDLRIIPERDDVRQPVRATRPSGGDGNGKKPRPAPPQKKSGGSSFLVSVLCLMMIVLSGAAAYLYFQTQSLLAQRAELDERVQVLEGKLSVTDESLSQSGAAIQSMLKTQDEELKLHMSEIRKLWAVAYDANRPKIEALEKSVASQGTKLTAAAVSIEKIEPLTADISDLKTKIDTTANQSLALSAGIDDVESSLRKQTDSISSLTSTLNSQKSTVQDHAQAIEAIDQYRIQINQRVLQLENQLRTP